MLCWPSANSDLNLICFNLENSYKIKEKTENSQILIKRCVAWLWKKKHFKKGKIILNTIIYFYVYWSYFIYLKWSTIVLEYISFYVTKFIYIFFSFFAWEVYYDWPQLGYIGTIGGFRQIAASIDAMKNSGVVENVRREVTKVCTSLQLSNFIEDDTGVVSELNFLGYMTQISVGSCTNVWCLE